MLHCIKGWSSDCPLIFENDEILGAADIFYPPNPFCTTKSDIKYPPLSVERAIHIISTNSVEEKDFGG